MRDSIYDSVSDIVLAKSVILAGMIGGLLSMSFVDGMNKKQRIVAIASGMAMAHYLAPLIAFLFHAEDYQETIGFLIGLFGMSVCSTIFRAIKNSDIWALIQQRVGKKSDL
jgi:hypothetical protein